MKNGRGGQSDAPVAPYALRMPVGSLYFVGEEDNEQGRTRANVFVLDLGAGTLRRLTVDVMARSVAVAGDDLVVAAWSREGPNRLWRLADSALEMLLPAVQEAGVVDVQGDRLVWGSDDAARDFGASVPRHTVLCRLPDGDVSVAYRSERPFIGPSFSPDGSFAVVEWGSATAARARTSKLVVVPPVGAPRAASLSVLGARWFVNRPLWGPQDVIAVDGAIGPNRDRTAPAVALVDPSGKTARKLDEARAICWSPDRSALLVQRPHPTAFGLALLHLEDDAAVLERACTLPVRRVRSAVWVPGELASDTGDHMGPPISVVPWEGLDRVDWMADDRLRAVEASARRAPVWVSAESLARLDEYGGDLRVTIRDASDNIAAARALDAARDDLYWLGTSPSDEGEVEIPSFVSPVGGPPDAPFVVIDANDTDPTLLRRIPSILQRHLSAAGVTSAEILLGDIEST